jgi:hypothetical protein
VSGSNPRIRKAGKGKKISRLDSNESQAGHTIFARKIFSPIAILALRFRKASLVHASLRRIILAEPKRPSSGALNLH